MAPANFARQTAFAFAAFARGLLPRRVRACGVQPLRERRHSKQLLSAAADKVPLAGRRELTAPTRFLNKLFV